MLRPLVHLMMRSGVTFPVLADMLRHLFVEVAADDILTQPNARTDSRISLLTGVHRKEIKRLREFPPDRAAPPAVLTIGSQIIARWLAAAPFTDADGQALPLARGTEAGAADASFEALVASVTTDIRPRAVLDDWLSQGIVRLENGDRVLLNHAAFIPKPGGQEQLFYFARNLHDHVAAAVANITAAEAAPFLDRSVHYDGLTPEQARELEAFARAAATRVMLEVNRRGLELVEAGQDSGLGPRRRVNLGVFVFNDADQPDCGTHRAAGEQQAARTAAG